MPKIYFYKLSTDNGGAPCLKGGLLSLAICKPMIRTTSEPGDIIFGFAANSMHADNRLLYIAEITGKIEGGDYYRSDKYAKRDDCIYSWGDGRFQWQQGARYHGPGDLVHDLGAHPTYDKANVLLSDNYRYLGSSGTSKYKERFSLIKDAVEFLGRGHRVNHVDELRSELLGLKSHVWTKHTEKVCGKPSHPPRRNACQRSRSCGVI